MKRKSKSNKPAQQKALEVLLYRDHSRKELYEKLQKYDYSESEIETALEYASKYGYLNDERFAANFVNFNISKLGKNAIYRELKSKGIDPEIIERELESQEIDENEVIYELLKKRAGEPHELDDKEYRRCFGYLARRGFSQSEIHKALHRYVDEAEELADGIFDD